MVRRGGPSRGCRTCRERRVKCDETLPECMRCLRLGRQCPGPITGVFIVDMTGATATVAAAAVEGAGAPPPPPPPPPPERPCAVDERPSSAVVVLRSRDSASPSRLLPIRIADGSSSGNGLSKPDGAGVGLTADGRRQRPSETLGVAAAPQFQLPSSHQPSRAAAFQLHFVSHLISSLRSPLLYQTRPQSWAFELPALLASGGPTTIYSIRAAAMAFYGNLAGDESIQADACRWYSMGLTSQRSLLQTDRPPRMPTMEEIFAPIMFSIFEVVLCTSPSGWIHHLSAAGRMLEMRGPKNCQDGIIHMLFRTARLSSVFITVTTEKPSVFASEAWSSIPFSLHPKTIFDKLVDILLQLPGCQARRNQIKALEVQNPHKSAAARTELRARVASLISRLDGWWRQYEEEKKPRAEYHQRKSSSPDKTANPSTTTSLYHAANILAQHLLLTTTPPPANHHQEKTTTHSLAILHAAKQQSRSPGGGQGVLVMVFPLKVVCRLAQDEQQRACARALLENLGQKSGVDGICKRAAPLYAQPYR